MDIIRLMIPGPDPPMVSIVIPTYNGAAYLEDCLRSLVRQSFQSMEIIVVDNASTDHSAEIVRRVAPRALLLRQQKNLGFAGGVNAGMRVAKGEWIALLNNDAFPEPEWLAGAMAAAGRHPDAGFLACRILEKREEGRLFSAGDCFLRAGIGYRRGQELTDREDYRKEGRIFSACGCAAFYRRDALQQAGAFDERFFAYLEDVDLGLRLQAAGVPGYYAAGAEVFHVGGATSGGEFSPLAVRLRTRNSLLLLIKSIPARILLRCAPMILASQAVWLARVVAHGRVWSYVRGLAGVLPLISGMMSERRKLRNLWSREPERLWRDIVKSESVARNDFIGPNSNSSGFLRWYFGFFTPPRIGD